MVQPRCSWWDELQELPTCPFPGVSGIRIPSGCLATLGNPPLWTGNVGLAMSPEVQDLDFAFHVLSFPYTVLAPESLPHPSSGIPPHILEVRSDLGSHMGLAPWPGPLGSLWNGPYMPAETF